MADSSPSLLRSTLASQWCAAWKRISAPAMPLRLPVTIASGESVFLSELAAKLVASAKGMASASEHVARVLAPYKGMARFRLWQAALRQALEGGGGVDFANLLQSTGEATVARLFAQGVLQNREGLGASLAAAVGTPPMPPKITSVGIPTANRPEVLQRALESYLPHFQAHQRSVRIIVSDDSRDAALAERNRAVAAEAAQKHSMTVQYLGAAERQALIDTHAHGDAQRRKALEFLLVDADGLGQTYGMPRNALLLATQGEMLFCADDDTLCREMSAPGLRPGLEWCDGPSEVMPVFEVGSHRRGARPAAPGGAPTSSASMSASSAGRSRRRCRRRPPRPDSPAAS